MIHDKCLTASESGSICGIIRPKSCHIFFKKKAWMAAEKSSRVRHGLDEKNEKNPENYGS
jgi:hypothetical protein